MRMSIGMVERDARAHHMLLKLFARLPRPFRFLGVGTIGLTTDVAVFTILMAFSPRPLLMRLFSLAVATLVTWRFEVTGPAFCAMEIADNADSSTSCTSRSISRVT